MTDAPSPIDELLRSHVAAFDTTPERSAAIRAAALDELRHTRRRSSWRYRIESTAMLTAAAAQLVWVIGSLFGQ